MSRSLDKELLESLKSEDPTIVWKDISQVLTSLPLDGSLLEIELLGKAHPLETGVHFLQDDNAIAVPKLRLVEAFFVARKIIQRHIATCQDGPSKETVAATAVVLLMDPEHLTAANIRKKAILVSSEASALGLQKEKQFLDSLLTARLHRHTKSPTLWSHRRWLMERFKVSGITIDVREDLTRVIMVAAERHPRNYYAWHHARWLLSLISVHDELQTKLLLAVADDVQEWCLRHHNDVSGWTFLSFVLLAIPDHDVRRQKCYSVLNEILKITRTFRWTNESVWVFLRMMMSREGVSNQLFKTFVDLNKDLSAASGEDPAARRHLDAAIRWSSR